MRLVRAVRNRPVLLLAAAAVGFAAWVVWDAVTPRQEGTALRPDRPWGDEAPNPAALLGPIVPGPRQVRNLPRPGVVTADLIPRLLPGMTRTAVEDLIGPPPDDQLRPVTNVDGRLTYRATYPANLGPAMPLPPGTTAPGPMTIGLEFDATRPGHPLVKVHIPDPMS